VVAQNEEEKQQSSWTRSMKGDQTDTVTKQSSTSLFAFEIHFIELGRLKYLFCNHTITLICSSTSFQNFFQKGLYF